MENTQKVYRVVGRTKANKWCTSGHCSTPKVAIVLFIEKYPRFRGCGMIESQVAEICGDEQNKVFVTNPAKWDTFDFFCSSKEIKKDYLPNSL